MAALDDECKPDIGVQVATKLAADDQVIAAVTHSSRWWRWRPVEYTTSTSLPVVVWGAVLPDITYGNDYPEIHRVNGTMINQEQRCRPSSSPASAIRTG